MVSYTSNELLNHVWKGGEHLPPTLNEQTSIYLQIAKMLEDGILRGIYPEDTQVPSTNELARTLCINPATAAKGLNLLTEDGILYKRRGIGMFVAPRAAEKIRAKRKQTFFEQYVRPLAAEAKNIGITPAELQAHAGPGQRKGVNDGSKSFNSPKSLQALRHAGRFGPCRPDAGAWAHLPG